ncbi:MAG: hypothetical protein EOO63_06305 [Hymenobacter sp.]|nr:MAG: hypothetical protein EOO63_06305 [Hymenobacter sp.]
MNKLDAAFIAAALFPVSSYSTVPSAYEQLLADSYILGTLNVYQSVELLEECHRAIWLVPAVATEKQAGE